MVIQQTGLSDKIQAYLAMADRTAIAVGTFLTTLEYINNQPLYGVAVAVVGIAIAVIKEAEGVLGGTPLEISKFISDIQGRIKAIEDFLKPTPPATPAPGTTTTTTSTTTGATTK